MAWQYKLLARGGKLLTTGGKAIVLTDSNRSAMEDCCCGGDPCTPETECIELLTPPQTIAITITGVPRAHCDAVGTIDPNAGDVTPTAWETLTWLLTLRSTAAGSWYYDDNRVDCPANPRNAVCASWLAGLTIEPDGSCNFDCAFARTKFDANGDEEWYANAQFLWWEHCGDGVEDNVHYLPKSGVIFGDGGACVLPWGGTAYHCDSSGFAEWLTGTMVIRY